MSKHHRSSTVNVNNVCIPDLECHQKSILVVFVFWVSREDNCKIWMSFSNEHQCDETYFWVTCNEQDLAMQVGHPSMAIALQLCGWSVRQGTCVVECSWIVKRTWWYGQVSSKLCWNDFKRKWIGVRIAILEQPCQIAVCVQYRIHSTQTIDDGHKKDQWILCHMLWQWDHHWTGDYHHLACASWNNGAGLWWVGHILMSALTHSSRALAQYVHWQGWLWCYGISSETLCYSRPFCV